MSTQSFVFIGRSGCGKGTQALLLIEALKMTSPPGESLYIQTGAEIRKFTEGPSLTQKLIKERYDTGSLMPEFLTVVMWAHALIERYTGKEHLIFDGTPRRLHEAQVFSSVFEFYKLGKPWVINIEINPEEALKRLLLRKRRDDNAEDIKERLSWFESEVVPVIYYFEKNPRYNYLAIDGERSVEEIHADIIKKTGLG
ncbi:MAG: adenylate kinase [Candidatus Parcubacteria bacterium]|jgi:adenylate kinase family enzyme|nr:adenylate kinase [Candidatus Parcubacteria bacterium]